LQDIQPLRIAIDFISKWIIQLVLVKWTGYMTDTDLKFLADRMVGRLAKWLRIMGQDCTYLRQGSMVEIVQIAQQENRVLLSRQSWLQTKPPQGLFLFIQSDHLEFQLRQVVEAFSLDPIKDAFSRCIECNQALILTSVETAGHRIPEYVRKTQAQLACCPNCHRFYWNASHRKRMLGRLMKLQPMKNQ
jgi:uncharacterized protein